MPRRGHFSYTILINFNCQSGLLRDTHIPVFIFENRFIGQIIEQVASLVIVDAEALFLYKSIMAGCIHTCRQAAKAIGPKGQCGAAAFPSITGSPQPVIPASVSIFKNSQRGGTWNNSYLFIFINIPVSVCIGRLMQAKCLVPYGLNGCNRFLLSKLFRFQFLCGKRCYLINSLLPGFGAFGKHQPLQNGFSLGFA